MVEMMLALLMLAVFALLGLIRVGMVLWDHWHKAAR